MALASALSYSVFLNFFLAYCINHVIQRTKSYFLSGGQTWKYDFRPRLRFFFDVVRFPNFGIGMSKLALICVWKLYYSLCECYYLTYTLFEQYFAKLNIFLDKKKHFRTRLSFFVADKSTYFSEKLNNLFNLYYTEFFV